jgi:hypothetical protein
MKKNAITMLALAISMAFMLNCGGGKTKVETTPEMQEFMEMIKGTSSDVTKALVKFATEELKNHDMAMYDLSDAVAVAQDGDCYTMEAKAGVTTRVYKICWDAGKIYVIEFLEMK